MSECIEYVGYRNRQDYGRFMLNGRQWLAHRYTWTVFHGPIPEGMCVCHHCDNPPCINVEHLWLGTNLENLQDMWAKGRARGRLSGVTECKRGHPLSGDNVHLNPKGARVCLACRDMLYRKPNPKTGKYRVPPEVRDIIAEVGVEGRGGNVRPLAEQYGLSLPTVRGIIRSVGV